MWQEVLALIPEEDKVSPLQFEKFFFRSRNFSTLRMKALNGKLPELRNRLVCWRVFLNLLPETDSPQAWVQHTQQLRTEYARFCKGHDTVIVADEHPLSPAASNPWNAQFEERQLRAMIKQDVDRTNQNQPLFRTEAVKEALTRILMTWARRNPAISYHQGMNELAGILLYVALCEQAAFEVDIVPEAAQFLMQLNDPEAIEADVFWMFNSIMDLGIKDLYKGRDTQEEVHPLDPQPKRRGASVLKRINDIHHVYLKFTDGQLYAAMENNGIEPQLYLL